MAQNSTQRHQFDQLLLSIKSVPEFSHSLGRFPPLAAAVAPGHDRPAEIDPFEPFAKGSFGGVQFPGSSGNIVAVRADPMRSLCFSGCRGELLAQGSLLK